MISKEWLTRKGLSRELWEPLVVPAIVILVGLSAFALGRLSAEAPSGAGLFNAAEAPAGN